MNHLPARLARQIILHSNRRLGLWFLSHLPKKVKRFETVVIYKGVKLIVYTGDKIGKEIYYYSNFEPWQIDSFRSLLKEGMIVFDIGANIGIYSLIAAANGAKVFAFEPVPKIFEILKKNIELNNSFFKVTPICEAISDTAGLIDFYVGREENQGVSRIFDDREQKNSSVIKVKSNTIDYWADIYGKPDIIKIDIEGAEACIFRGNSKLLEKEDAPILFVEFHPELMEFLGNSMRESLEYLAKCGYKMWVKKGEEKLAHSWCVFSKRDIVLKNFERGDIEKIGTSYKIYAKSINYYANL